MADSRDTVAADRAAEQIFEELPLSHAPILNADDRQLAEYQVLALCAIAYELRAARHFDNYKDERWLDAEPSLDPEA